MPNEKFELIQMFIIALAVVLVLAMFAALIMMNINSLEVLKLECIKVQGLWISGKCIPVVVHP